MVGETLSYMAFLEYEGERDVGKTQEEGPVTIPAADLNRVLMRGGPCAGLRSSMTAIGQLSNRKGCNQICNSAEDGPDPERLEKGRQPGGRCNSPGERRLKD